MTATVSHDLAVAGGGVLLIAAVLIVVGRALARRGASPLVTRKIPHALCGLFAALAAFQLSHGVVVAGVLAAATVALTVIVERGLIPVPGVFVLGLADAGAALIGDRYGRHRVEAGGGVRSLEGSVAFVAIAFAVSWVFCRVGLELNTFMAVSVSLFVAMTTAAVELLVLPAADNLLITPWVALLLHVARELSTDDALRWLAAVVFGCAIVPFMLRMRWLDLPGALAGGLIAGVAVGLGGWAWIIPAALFFSLTSLLTAYRRPTRSGGMRTLSQVAVNAGLPVLVPVIGYAFTRDPLWYAVSIGGIAAGIADSWASEIGRFSSREPLSLRT